jgi:hypothetical protein
MTEKLIISFMVIFLLVGISASWLAELQNTQNSQRSPDPVSKKSGGLVVVGESDVDLGNFNSGDPIGYHFILCNTSERNIRILAIQTSCGCMKASDSLIGVTIPSSEEIEIPVIMKTENRSGDLSGVVQIVCGQEPISGTRITETSTITLNLRCNIQNRIRVTPDNLDFGTIVTRETASIPILVERTDGGSLRDVAVSVIGEHFLLQDYQITSESGLEKGMGRVLPSNDVFSSGGFYGGSLQLVCEDIGTRESVQIVNISAISEPELSTVPRNVVLFARRKPTAELALIGSASDFITDIFCSPSLAEVIEWKREASTLRVTMKPKGGQIDQHVSGEILILYQKYSSGQVTNEQCSVRVLAVP